MEQNSPDPTELQANIAWLQMIQAVISRMSGYGFMLKGWGLTIVAALLALAVGDAKNSDFALLAVLPVLIFWVLDGWFLQTETRFRNLYDWARKQSAIAQQFDINPHNTQMVKIKSLSAYVFSRTLWPFWGVLAIVSIMVWGWGA